jgi:ribosomal protein S27AE
MASSLHMFLMANHQSSRPEWYVSFVALTYLRDADGTSSHSWRKDLKGAKKQRPMVKKQKRLVRWIPFAFCTVVIAHTHRRYCGRCGSFLATDSKSDSRAQRRMSQTAQAYGYSSRNSMVLLCSFTSTLIASKAPSEAEAQCAELARGGKVLGYS